MEYPRSAAEDRLEQFAAAYRERGERVLDEISKVLKSGQSADELREAGRSTPLLDVPFAIDSQDRIVHPASNLSQQEREFLDRARPLLNTISLLPHPAEVRNKAKIDSMISSTIRRGWRSFTWNDGQHLLAAFEQENGGVVGSELNYARILALFFGDEMDLPLLLPSDTITLTDSTGTVAFQWGAASAPQIASRALGLPLAGWMLRYHAAPTGGSLAINYLLGYIAVGGVIVTLALSTHRDQRRQARAAAQRVTFVNQVSHELKTPLTNIRMYAELLRERIGDDDPSAVEQLAVVTSESERLSRLISNILSFASDDRGALTVHPAAHALGPLVESVVAQFAHGFAARRMRIELLLDAEGTVLVDRDALHQILGNLLSNDEKYAGESSAVQLRVRLDGEIC